MSGAVCPSCGVAVVPGYVRCPKCQAPLPRRASPVVGGTALPEARRFPVLAVVVAVFVALAIIVFFGLRKSDRAAKRPVAEPAPATAVPPQTPAAAPAATPEPATPAAVAPSGPSASQIAADLERTLKRQRLWSTVNVIGERVEVRSGSCADPAMAPVLDTAAPSFKAAGLTKLRCLEQSGAVVTDRDL